MVTLKAPTLRVTLKVPSVSCSLNGLFVGFVSKV